MNFLQRGQWAGLEAQRLCREGSEQKKNHCVRRNMKVEIREAVQQHTGTAHQRPRNKRPRAAPRRNLKIGKSSAEEQSDEKRAANAAN